MAVYDSIRFKKNTIKTLSEWVIIYNIYYIYTGTIHYTLYTLRTTNAFMRAFREPARLYIYTHTHTHYKNTLALTLI